MNTGYLRIGDRVVLRKGGAQTRGDGFEGPPLIVTGFKQLVVGHVTHGYRADRKPIRPGIYLDTTHVGVATESGISATRHYWHRAIKLAADKEAELRGPRQEFPDPVFLRELPDTPLWVGDIVEHSFVKPNPLERMYVTAVDYFGCTSNGDNLPLHVPAYLLGETFQPGYIWDDTTGLKEASRLNLVERGNVWRHYHGEKLDFVSLREQVQFHILMGWFTPLRLQDRSFDHATELVNTGKAHGYFTVGNWNSPAWQVHVINFTDQNVGKGYQEFLRNGSHAIAIPS